MYKLVVVVMFLFIFLLVTFFLSLHVTMIRVFCFNFVVLFIWQEQVNINVLGTWQSRKDWKKLLHISKLYLVSHCKLYSDHPSRITCDIVTSCDIISYNAAFTTVFIATVAVRAHIYTNTNTIWLNKINTNNTIIFKIS